MQSKVFDVLAKRHLVNYISIRITKTLEHYHGSSYNPQENPSEREPQSWYYKVSKLRGPSMNPFNALKDLGPFSVKELQNLGKQLQGALMQTRQRKTQVMIEQVEELKRSECHLADKNKQLKMKVSFEMSSVQNLLQQMDILKRKIIQALGWLTSVPGASSTVLEAVVRLVPYSRMSMTQLLSKVRAHFASLKTAEEMTLLALKLSKRGERALLLLQN